MGEQRNSIYFQNEILFDNTPITTYESLNNDRQYYSHKEQATQNLNYQDFHGRDYASQYPVSQYFQGYYEQSDCYQPMNQQNIEFSSYENMSNNNNHINNSNNYNNNNNEVPQPKINQIYANSFVKQIFVSSEQNYQLLNEKNENTQNKNQFQRQEQQQFQQQQYRSQQDLKQEQEQIVPLSSNNYEQNLVSYHDNYVSQTNNNYPKFGTDFDYQVNSSSFNGLSNQRSSALSENDFDNYEEYSSYLKSIRAKEERMQKKQQKKQKLIEETQQLPKRILRSQQICSKSSNYGSDSDPSNQSASTCQSYEYSQNISVQAENQLTLQQKMQDSFLNQNSSNQTQFQLKNESYNEITFQSHPQNKNNNMIHQQNNQQGGQQGRDFTQNYEQISNNNIYSNNNNNLINNNIIYNTNNQYQNNLHLYQQNELSQEFYSSFDANFNKQNNPQVIEKTVPTYSENRILYSNFENNRSFQYNQNEKNSYTDIISCNASQQLLCSNQQLTSQANQIESFEEIEDHQDFVDALNAIDLQAVTKKNVVKNIMSAFKRFICYIFEYKQNEKSAALAGKHHLFTKQQRKIYFQDNEQIAQQSIELCKDIILNIFKNSHNIPIQTSEIDFFKKFKRYINHKQFNNSTISLLIKHENYGPIFKFYLENYIQKWIDNSLNSNQKSHEDIIKYILCSFANIKLLDQFIYRCRKQQQN